MDLMVRLKPHLSKRSPKYLVQIFPLKRCNKYLKPVLYHKTLYEVDHIFIKKLNILEIEYRERRSNCRAIWLKLY